MNLILGIVWLLYWIINLIHKMHTLKMDKQIMKVLTFIIVTRIYIPYWMLLPKQMKLPLKVLNKSKMILSRKS